MPFSNSSTHFRRATRRVRVFAAEVSYSDSEIAISAENYQAGRVARDFYERHERALLAYGKSCGAEEIAREVLVDALMEWWRQKRSGAELQPPLAVAWRRSENRGSLRSYLQRCIKTRSADRQQARSRAEPFEDSAALGTVAPVRPTPDRARIERACGCWAAAVQATARKLPQATLCAWLTELCGRQAKALQKLLHPARNPLGSGGEWRENAGTVSRLIAQYERERGLQLERAREAARLTADDLDEARELYPGCLPWGELPVRTPWPALKKAELARLAEFAGGIPLPERKSMIEWLVQRPDAVRQLALYLPAQGTRERGPVIQPTSVADAAVLPSDPLLAGRRGFFHTEARKRSGAMTPAELLAKLGPSAGRVFQCLLSATGADSGTLWLRQGRRLQAVLNPREADVLGLSVPANLGFVHQCLRDEKPLAVQPQAARDGPRHFTGIDARLRRPVYALITVPYRQFGEVAGVVTLVRFAPEAPAFSPSHLADAVAFAKWAGGLLEARLQREAIRRVREVESLLRDRMAEALREYEPAALYEALELAATGSADPESALSAPTLKRLFAWILAEAGADAGTLWLRRGEELEAVLNPHEPAMAGQRQAIGEGIIGSVFRTGRMEVTPDVPADARYQPRLDREVSRRSTHSMVTAPFSLFGSRAGVVTMVRQTPELGPLSRAALQQARLLAALLQRHLEDASRFRLLDPSPEIDRLESGKT